jgi:predicted metal-binding membrane protein
VIYNRNAAKRIQRCLALASCAAWAAIIVPSLWSGQEPAAMMCGTSWIPGSTTGWALSVGMGWLLMAIAMMTPLTLQPLMHIWIASFNDRRWRSFALFLFGFLVIWLIAGWGTKLLELAMKRYALDGPIQVGLGAAIALLWQASPLKQRCLNQCHAHRPLAAFGRAADLDALRFGLEHAIWCVGSCWALMLFADSLAQWHMTGMALVALLMYCERMDPPKSPSWRLRGFQTALLRLRRAYQSQRSLHASI